MAKSIYSPDYIVLMQMLREARRDAKLTQAALAERLSLLQCEVSNYERGEKRLDLIELKAVLDACGADFVEFMARYAKAVG